jgi:hypothetical protein
MPQDIDLIKTFKGQIAGAIRSANGNVEPIKKAIHQYVVTAYKLGFDPDTTRKHFAGDPESVLALASVANDETAALLMLIYDGFEASALRSYLDNSGKA